MCKYCAWLMPVIVIVFTFWTFSLSKWIVLVAALLMLWHGMSCGGSCCSTETPKTKPKVKAKSKKKK